MSPGVPDAGTSAADSGDQGRDVASFDSGDTGPEDGAVDGGLDSGVDSGCSLLPCQSGGLRLWLDPSVQINVQDGGVATWLDRAGGTITATQTGRLRRPHYDPTGWNGSPTVNFDGVDDALWFFLPIEGWSKMTIILVASPELSFDPNQDPPPPGGPSRNTALFWDERVSWGSTFIGPFTGHLTFRFGTTIVDNNSIFSRTTTVSTPETIVIRKDGPVEVLRLNGVLRMTELGRGPAIAGTEGQARLGFGYNNSFFRGRLGDMLIFDQALSDLEIQGIESFLAGKYGIPGS